MPGNRRIAWRTASAGASHGAAWWSAALERPDAGRLAALAGPLVLLALGTVYFAARGPYRAWAGMDDRDLTILYAAALAWINGVDPYDRQALSDLAAGAGTQLGAAWSLYPPPTLVLLSTIAFLPWPVAEKASVIANVALELACIGMAMRVADMRPTERRGVLFAGAVLVLAPFHTAISEGQLSIAVAALLAAFVLAQQQDRPIAAGLCVGLAAAIKPQMGLIFLVLLLLRCRRPAVVAAAGALACVAIVGAGRLAAAGVDWLPGLLANLDQSGFADATTSTTQRRNLQALLHALAPGADGTAINLVTYAVAVTALAVLIRALRHRAGREADLLLASGFAVVTLLVVYNRSYAATVLVLPLAWAFAAVRMPEARWAAIGTVAASSVFLVPGAAALARTRPPAVLDWIGPWWPVLQLHQVLALLVVLACILVAARHRAPGWPSVEPEGTEAPAIIAAPC